MIKIPKSEVFAYGNTSLLLLFMHFKNRFKVYLTYTSFLNSDGL